jgi:glycosyltransferase involved in cell wall biosynthesis
VKITLINTMDVQGGAARAAYRLHKGLRGIGAESTYFVRDRRLNEPTVRQFIPDPSDAAVRHRAKCKAQLASAYNAYQETRDTDMEDLSSERVDGDENFFVQRPPADIFNLHWVAGFVDYHMFFTLERTNSPVVWTLHDMNPFTGGCHYDGGCNRFREQCGKCPVLGSDADTDITRDTFAAKAAIFEKWPDDRLHIVAPSQWLRDAARSSALFRKFDTTCIPYGIETDVYRPMDKLLARSRLGLPADARVVFFISHHVGQARKGFHELVEALSLMPDTKNLILIGIGDKANIPVDAPFRVLQIKYISNDEKIAEIYSAADITALPSRQDNLPNTMLESLSCATPVVGFRVGGIPDMIKDGETGFLGDAGNVESLGAALVDAFSDMDRLRECGLRGRTLIEKQHTLSAQAHTYMELYQSMHDVARAKRGY